MAEPARRLVAVDAARGVALLAMMAVHVLPGLDPDGTVSTTDAIARGRASAAFAVLAGVALALAYGGRTPLHGRPWAAASAGLVVRCVLVAALGLTLGGVGSGLAIILVHYALLFVLAVPLLAMSAGRLARLAVALCLVTPVLSHLLRQGLPPMRGSSPVWPDLAVPGTLMQELFLTGYYPVLGWTTYVCAGLAVGRLDLTSRRVGLRVLGTGAGLAVGSVLASRWLVARGQVEGALPADADEVVVTGETPTDSWWWLVLDSPHSTTSLDLAHTTGTALVLLGALLLVGQRFAGWLRPLAWVGGMTLTLYTLHAIALSYDWGPDDPEQLWVTHVVAVLLVGAAWRSWARRGPLEEVVSSASAGAAHLVRGRG